MFGRLEGLFVGLFNHLMEPFDNPTMVTFWFREGIKYVAWLLLPFMGVLFFAALMINVQQVGFVLAWESLKPKWKNLNVFDPSNYKRFFQLQSFMRLIFGLGKLSIIAVVLYTAVNRAAPEISNMMKAEPRQIFIYLAMEAFFIGMLIAMILFLLAVIDTLYQKWKFSQDMKMTKQEIKDERKQAEGDVHVKSKIRSMMQSFAQSRQQSNVPHADVVIANPIHYAIAVKYDADKMAAPICVAKGARKVALAIKELAREHDIPIVENPPLAQGLYKSVDVGGHIPPNFYHSVAEVLAYVYRLNEKLGRAANQ